jgi:hypothetical protein
LLRVKSRSCDSATSTPGGEGVNQASPEAGPHSEFLVIITGPQPDEIRRGLRGRYQVTQSISTRVFLVRADATGLQAPSPEGCQVFSQAHVPEEILESLDEGESLFVSAWLARLRQAPKRRRGEGLDWDDPGFEPPR